MIIKITFENFKRFKNESLDLSRPITLLYGENSSGKSSALKGIATLIQTFTWPRNQYEPLLTQGEYANLGTYRDYVRDHIATNKITITLETLLPEWYRSVELKEKEVIKQITTLCYERSPYNEQARLYSVSGAYALEGGEIAEVFKIKKSETKSWYTLVTGYESLKDEVSTYASKDGITEREIKREANLKTKISYVEGFRFSLIDKEAQRLGGDKLRIAQNCIYSLFDLPGKYKYLGPLRSSPSRSYTLSAASSDVGAKGENTPSVISYLKRSSDSIRKNGEAYKKIQQWIDLIFPGRSISVQDYEELVKLKVVRGGEIGRAHV